jgi:hypothetical protein
MAAKGRAALARLARHLAYLSADIDLAYDKPTAAQYAVFDRLNSQTQAGEQKLQTAITVTLSLSKGPSP